MWETASSTSAEVAIGIAGFAGLVAAISSQRSQRFSAEQSIQLQLLLVPAGIAIAFALVPFLLVARLSEAHTWATMSALYVLWFTLVASSRIRQAVKGSILWTHTWQPVTGAAIVIPVSLANTIWWHSFEAYFVFVLMQLAVAFRAFTLLLLALVEAGPAKLPADNSAAPGA